MARNCPKCGAEVYNDVCPQCYTRLSPLEQSSKQSAGHQECSRKASQQEYSQRTNSSVAYRNQCRSPANPAVFPLRYHKFLIYFGMWVWLFLLITCLKIACDESVPVKGAFILRLYYLFAAFFCINIRDSLAKFKKGAPLMYVILRLIDLAVSAIMAIRDIIYESVMGAVVLGIILLTGTGIVILEWRYYSKRAELFVN